MRHSEVNMTQIIGVILSRIDIHVFDMFLPTFLFTVLHFKWLCLKRNNMFKEKLGVRVQVYSTFKINTVEL